jgi:4-amino-4-deoxy-L-arabinose transferase-like glycosyltransferase
VPVPNRNTSNVLENGENFASWRANAYFACLLGAVALFYTATVRPGHLWADDFAMDVHHAQNIVEGRPYAETGYIYNPRAPAYSPGMYPPVFPLLLAPSYKFFGLNLLPMKLEQVAFFLLTLAAIYVLWWRELGSRYALAVIAILGCSPVFWLAKDSVLSDLPFLLFFYVAAVLVQRAPRDGKRWWVWAIFLGLTLYAAIGTRAAGIALIPGLVLYDALRHRRVTRFTGIALTLYISLAFLQHYLIGSAPGGYMEQLHAITPQTILFNLGEYSRMLAGFWVASVRNAFSFVVLAIVALLTAAGVFYQSKRGITIVEAFLAPYLGILLLWPYAAGVRAVYPIIPWIVFLALTGLRGISEKFVPHYSKAAVWGLLLMLAIPFAEGYRAMNFGPIRESQGMAEFNQLCDAVRNQSGPEDVFIYYRARALSLYTGRAASTYNYRGTGAELWQHLQKIHAVYLITTSAFDEDHGFLNRYVQDHSEELDLTYRNAKFSMYRIRSPRDAASAATSHRETPSN